MKAAVIGGSGYLGAELLRLLAGHPEIDAEVVQAGSSAGSRVASIYPGLEDGYGSETFPLLRAAAAQSSEELDREIAVLVASIGRLAPEK